MAPLRLIWPGRSDGTGERPPPSKLEKVTEKNGTTRWLEEVAKDEAKSRDWRKKLGQMLVMEMEKMTAKDGDEKFQFEEGMIYMLFDFPAGYTLYEQHTIKPSAKDGGQPEERRDSYLYGHPGGEKKRFRTPKEFFEHLWWLLTDDAEQPDPNNCTCPRCVPEDLHKEVYEFVTGQQFEVKATRLAQKATIAQAAPSRTSTPVTAPTRSTSTGAGNAGSVTKPEPVLAAAPAPNVPVLKMQQSRPTSSGRPAPKSHLAPAQPTEPRNQEQAEDAQLGSFIYRVGEVVWFSKGAAWGLGIIHSRARKPNGQTLELSYTVQPLSYPGANVSPVQVSQESQVKPWYAYSPPNPTHRRLTADDAINLAFNQIPWNQVVSGELGPGEAEVDASIYAAKTVDRSYSPIDRLAPATSMGPRSSYNGLFIGAEKIWRGDAVVLKNSIHSSNPEILIITDIIETTQQPPALDRPAPREAIFVVGDKYSYAQLPVKVPAGEPNPQQYLANHIPTRIPTLPDRVADDLMRQNRLSVPRHQKASSWRLVATKQQIPLSEIRGRWYESMRMLPIINPQLYQQALQAGQVPDVGRSLNARGDSTVLEGGSPGFRYPHREASLFQSVPPSFRLPDLLPVAAGGGLVGQGAMVGRQGQSGQGQGQGQFPGAGQWNSRTL